ncbi:hypothetical protein KIN20_030958 [Parelaphostrongylus tenuis]|uniref:Uncharacterized protein n=1 Tax=Parelaphostrongylus tenuis TaxID=148309 RepID=A0AAD5R4Y0_PARTN|nr:hypothetical protein KIN20_030958 [Parelaphostrongylus tenuis]
MGIKKVNKRDKMLPGNNRQIYSDAYEVRKLKCAATQMVQDLREQMVSQRFEDLKKGSNGNLSSQQGGEGGTRLAPTSTVISIAEHHPNAPLTSPGPPHLKS